MKRPFSLQEAEFGVPVRLNEKAVTSATVMVPATPPNKPGIATPPPSDFCLSGPHGASSVTTKHDDADSDLRHNQIPSSPSNVWTDMIDELIHFPPDSPVFPHDSPTLSPAASASIHNSHFFPPAATYSFVDSATSCDHSTVSLGASPPCDVLLSSHQLLQYRHFDSSFSVGSGHDLANQSSTVGNQFFPAYDQAHRHNHYQLLPQHMPLIASSGSQFISSQQQQEVRLRFGDSSQEAYLQNSRSSNFHKVLSAPQLNHLETKRFTRVGSNLAPMSIPLSAQSSQLQGSLPDRISTPGFPANAETDALSQKSSVMLSESCFSPLYPQSILGLPHSLPSMSHLSQPREYPVTNRVEEQFASLHGANSPVLNGSPRELGSGHHHGQHFGVTQSMNVSKRSQPKETQDIGLRLVHLLLACAEAVARDDVMAAEENLLELRQIVSTDGDSIQRVAAYFMDALRWRLLRTGISSYVASRSNEQSYADEMLVAYQTLYQVCPYIKFGHFTSNQAMLEAFDGEAKVHIVDLDIVQGYQWPAFIQALAARPEGAPHLRITGIGMPLEMVEETGKRLRELAESLHVPFEFHAVGERLENLKPYMLQRRIGEALAVNSVNRLHRLLSEPTNPLGGILHMILEQAPNIVTLVEQEASHNGHFFLGRFLEALHYYSAIFDSLDATLPRTSPVRTKVEQLIFAQEITNIVACEGFERIERHEKLEKWRKIMETVGFHNVALSANAVNQSKLLLGLYPCDGYTLIEDRGCLQLGWQDRPIVAASAWR